MSDLRTEIFTKVLPKMQSLTKTTELSNLTFDDPEQPEVPITPAHPEEITNNERIFNWVKENPACYAPQVVTGLEGQVIASSVISQLFVLAKRGILHKVKCSSTGRYMYSVALDEYPRFDRVGALERMRAAHAAIGMEEISRRIKEGHEKRKVEKAPPEPKAEPAKKKIVLVKKSTGEQVSPPPAVTVTPVDLNTLSIVQARKLYDELKQIFGA